MNKSSKNIQTIGITFNLKRNKDGDEEYDEIETIDVIKKELEQYGFKIILIEQDENWLININKAKVDFVFNIAEGRCKTRGRESQVPSVLESLNIPYSGSDSVSLGITLDKYLTNVFLKASNIPVPQMFLVNNIRALDSLKNVFKQNGSFIIKPRWEGSSKGICQNSIVVNFKKLKEKVKEVISEYEQPAIIEEFLEKDEITAAVCGNDDDISLLGMMKITYRNSRDKIFIYSLENKRDWQEKIKYEAQDTIPLSIQKKINCYAVKSFMKLELRDIARIDFRLDKNNIPKIIDINPLPGLSPSYSDLPILYKLAGGNYRQLLKIILDSAFKRYNFNLTRLMSACGRQANQTRMVAA